MAKFRVGQRVRCIKPNCGNEIGAVREVIAFCDGEPYFYAKGNFGGVMSLDYDCWEPLPETFMPELNYIMIAGKRFRLVAED